MPYVDPEKRRASQAARSRRLRAKQHAEKFGSDAGDMRGRHGNHASGERNGRWNAGRLVSSEGYVLVRVDPSHPRAFGPRGLRNFKYAYEHDLVMERRIGRHLTPNEIVHHSNGIRDDNRDENLTLETRGCHAREHTSVPGSRDTLGRFTSASRLRDRKGGDMSEWPEDLPVREFPEVGR